jgi:hypothetical protein
MVACILSSAWVVLSGLDLRLTAVLRWLNVAFQLVTRILSN